MARIHGEIVEVPLKTKNSYCAVTISPQAIEVLKQQKPLLEPVTATGEVFNIECSTRRSQNNSFQKF